VSLNCRREYGKETFALFHLFDMPFSSSSSLFASHSKLNTRLYFPLSLVSNPEKPQESTKKEKFFISVRGKNFSPRIIRLLFGGKLEKEFFFWREENFLLFL
jgi:hypothetical protein